MHGNRKIRSKGYKYIVCFLFQLFIQNMLSRNSVRNRSENTYKVKFTKKSKSSRSLYTKQIHNEQIDMHGDHVVSCEIQIYMDLTLK